MIAKKSTVEGGRKQILDWSWQREIYARKRRKILFFMHKKGVESFSTVGGGTAMSALTIT
jgi:hypothetical protein